MHSHALSLCTPHTVPIMPARKLHALLLLGVLLAVIHPVRAIPQVGEVEGEVAGEVVAIERKVEAELE